MASCGTFRFDGVQTFQRYPFRYHAILGAGG